MHDSVHTKCVYADDGNSVVLVFWQNQPGVGPDWYPSLDGVDDAHHACMHVLLISRLFLSYLMDSLK
jgi:hypothetical protein